MSGIAGAIGAAQVIAKHWKLAGVAVLGGLLLVATATAWVATKAAAVERRSAQVSERQAEAANDLAGRYADATRNLRASIDQQNKAIKDWQRQAAADRKAYLERTEADRQALAQRLAGVEGEVTAARKTLDAMTPPETSLEIVCVRTWLWLREVSP